jgi:ribosomal protein S18 acetylase RimI-like enzyme
MGEVLRRCRDDELDVLRELARRTYDDSFRHLNTPATMEAYLEKAFAREKLEGELHDPRSEFYFLERDGEIAGYMKVNEGEAQSDLRDPDGLEVERIYVTREAQGKGLGKSMLEAAERIARRKGKRYMWLGVWEKNVNAIAFYRRMGFREAGVHDFYMGEERQTDFMMRKEVAQA